MKRGFEILLALVIATYAITAARADIQLHGVIKNLDSYLFSLSDTEDKTSSQWVTIGSVYHGYKIIGFNSESEVVRLKKGDIETETKLQAVTINKEKSEPPIDILTVTDEELLTLGLYRIKPGDTLSKIARKMKILPDTLLKLNPSFNPIKLRVGQIFIIADSPQPSPPEPEPKKP